MNVCKVPDMCKDMEYKYITEDSKTRVYLSVVRKFNEAEYEKYYIRKMHFQSWQARFFTICFQISFISKEEAMKLAQK